MPLYVRKEPLEAYRWTGTLKALPAAWVEMGAIKRNRDGTATVTTSDRPAHAALGDRIARDAAGSLYVINRAVFEATYQGVEKAAPGDYITRDAAGHLQPIPQAEFEATYEQAEQ